MVHKVRRWLIKWLGVESLALQIVKLRKSLQDAQAEIKTLKDELDQISKLRVELQNSLTIAPTKPKIIPKSRMNWKSFRSAAEKATDKEPE